MLLPGAVELSNCEKKGYMGTRAEEICSKK
jgi:hypothetical protein